MLSALENHDCSSVPLLRPMTNMYSFTYAAISALLLVSAALAASAADHHYPSKSYPGKGYSSVSHTFPSYPTPSNANATGEPASEVAYRANAVKEAFQFAWSGYSTWAFPNDELLPVNNSFSNSRNGWGASAVDAFSTALVMQDQDIVNQILAYIPTIDFSVSYENEQVSMFETTIRYLGGMLSGYDLLKGPLAHLANNSSDVDALLSQAQTLADLMSFGFETTTGIPSNNLYFNNRSTDSSTTNGLATIGSLVLEWTHLSDLTGNQTYAQLAQKGESYLLNPQPASSEPFPGLLGTDVNITSGLFVDAVGGWQGGDDSYYEYLLKMFVYDSSRFATYRDQ